MLSNVEKAARMDWIIPIELGHRMVHSRGHHVPVGLCNKIRLMLSITADYVNIPSSCSYIRISLPPWKYHQHQQQQKSLQCTVLVLVAHRLQHLHHQAYKIKHSKPRFN